MWLNDVSMTDVEGSFGEFKLLADLHYQDSMGKVWTVPGGAVGDLASIPRFIQPFVSKTILCKTPWLHDYLYRTHPEGVTRAAADLLFREGAIDEGMSKWLAWTLWCGLRVGGWMAWRR